MDKLSISTDSQSIFYIIYKTVIKYLIKYFTIDKNEAEFKW